jgi:ribosomal protein S19
MCGSAHSAERQRKRCWNRNRDEKEKQDKMKWTIRKWRRKRTIMPWI